MSNIKELKDEITTSRDSILKAIVQCDERSKLGRRNAELTKILDKEINILNSKVKKMRDLLNDMVKYYKSIEKFLIDKEEQSLESLKDAITQAGLIVPDADIQGIHLAYRDKKASILSEMGKDVNIREGSAFRAVMSVLMRYTLIIFQPDAMRVILLDEAFATCSGITATEMREILPKICEDVLVVGIEQRSLIYQDIADVTYQAIKDKKHGTMIKKVS